MGSAPELCSGLHQKGCDLEGVEGAAPPNSHSFKAMTTSATPFNSFPSFDEVKPIPMNVDDLEPGVKYELNTKVSTNLRNAGKLIMVGGAACGAIPPLQPLGVGYFGIGLSTWGIGHAFGAAGMDEAEPDAAEFTTAQQGDLLTGITTNDENVGCSYVDKVTRPSHCEEMAKKYRDGLLNTDEQQNAQFDAVTGYALNNDDAASFDWFQMHHDDGIMDGYLDTAETANGDMIITEFPEFLPGQTITLDESGMDGLVAAGPFDAVTLNEPQNNNVF